jgi:hypothetical protein
MLLVLPGDAEVCRLTLNYQIEPLHYRLWKKLAPGVRNFATRVLPKKFTSEMSFWPSKARESGCKPILLEVNLPHAEK